VGTSKAAACSKIQGAVVDLMALLSDSDRARLLGGLKSFLSHFSPCSPNLV